MSNTNLFYKLYSNSNDKIVSPYVCSAAVDEHDTSFDISNDKGVITDSNGNTLASIDLSNVHVDDLTQYNIETQILQPNSYYVLEGKYWGEAYASYYYEIPDIITNTVNYDKFFDISFDIIYNNWKRKYVHCQIKSNNFDTIPTLINNELSALKIPVNATIQTLQDKEGLQHDYLVFTAEYTKYFFYLRNLLMEPCFQDENHINSPFSNCADELKQIIVDALNEYKPRLNGTYDKSDLFYNR